MINYTPKPESLAGKVFAHLQMHGGSLSGPEAGRLTGVPPKNVPPSLKAALQHGVLVKTGIRYHLPGADLAAAPVLPSLPAAAGPVSSMRGIAKKKTKKAPAKRATAAKKKRQARTPKPAPAPERLPACAALYDDGDVAVFDVVHTGDDGCLITEAKARRVHRFLDRIYGPVEATP